MERIYQRYFSLHENKKILCVARNYAAYLQPGEAKPTSPSFFDKPYSSLITDGQSLRLSPSQKEIFHEVELGLLIGMTGRNIKAD
jgi:acylpyruvate hydrolase